MTQIYINYCCACLKWDNCLALIILLETLSKTLCLMTSHWLCGVIRLTLKLELANISLGITSCLNSTK